jgi:hypothetical protein
MKAKLSIIFISCLLLGVFVVIASTAAQNVADCDPAYVSQDNGVITVEPTGVDDTANIQCAFNAAVSAETETAVHLSPGDFYTEQIVVNDFQSSFTGAGPQHTKIYNLPNLYVTPKDMYYEPPSAENPWPALFAFVDGNFTISDLAVHIVGQEPTQGWTIFDIPTPLKEMALGIVILGTEAHVDVDNILVAGEAGPDFAFGYNTINGIFFEGFIGEVPTPLSGSFAVTRSTFRNVSSGAPVSNIVDASILISHNEFEEVGLAMDGGDFVDSTFEFSHNKVNAGDGLSLYNMFNMEDSGSSYLIRNNQFRGKNGPMYYMTIGEGSTCLFQGNNTRHVTDVGIYLGEGTQGCKVLGYHKNVVDLGTDNEIR